MLEAVERDQSAGDDFVPGRVVEAGHGGDATGVAGPVGVVDAAAEGRPGQLTDTPGHGGPGRCDLGVGEAVGHSQKLRVSGGCRAVEG